MKKYKTYICDACRKEFDSDWSDEEAMKEANELWGDLLGKDPAIICDDCFQKGIVKFN